MKRHKHNLSHYKLLTGNMGKIIPIGCVEVLPGTTLQQATSLMVRCGALNAPVMHPVNVKVHHWYVPTRLVWEDFENFITGGPDGNDASIHPFIRLHNGNTVLGSLADYFGCPPLDAGMNRDVSAIPFRAYNFIFNTKYRDPDLFPEVGISLASGHDTVTVPDVRDAMWDKDYFTTCRPTPQKGADVVVPLGTSAPVVFPTDLVGNRMSTSPGGVDQGQLQVDGVTGNVRTSGPSGSVYQDARVVVPGPGDAYANLEYAVGPSITDWRLAFALQRYKEARSMWGSRYDEYLAYCGVKSSDARLQQPEFLGGGKQTIQFSEILQTAEGDNPVGTLRGHGIGALRSNRYRKYFEEHGVIISVAIILPVPIYADGMPKMFHKTIKEDYFQKELEQIGQQEVYNREVYIKHSEPGGVFGWNNRYQDYRQIPSTISGEFRTSLGNYWHMARLLASEPALNADFVTANPTTRVFSQSLTHQLQIYARHSIQCRSLVSNTNTHRLI